MYKLGALLLGIVAGGFAAVAMAATAAPGPDSSLVPPISSNCLSIDGVPHRVVQWHSTWVEASAASTTAPPEWINVSMVKKLRELPKDACR